MLLVLQLHSIYIVFIFFFFLVFPINRFINDKQFKTFKNIFFIYYLYLYMIFYCKCKCKKVLCNLNTCVTTNIRPASTNLNIFHLIDFKLRHEYTEVTLPLFILFICCTVHNLAILLLHTINIRTLYGHFIVIYSNYVDCCTESIIVTYCI
ncbi:hypothetical protein NQD34_018212 [Periophthalmus magnuspinnatus]|nr:hypothetical protein NQD34_018212 [Periophthalmus magnuspinnatus]